MRDILWLMQTGPKRDNTQHFDYSKPYIASLYCPISVQSFKRNAQCVRYDIQLQVRVPDDDALIKVFVDKTL